MKRFILSTVICSLFFASCEQEEINVPHKEPEQTGNGDYIINPEDTAGIVVPEGHALVVFPGNSMQTKAALQNESTNRISHLRYLIYREEGEVYKFYKEKVVFSGGGEKSWPQKAITAVLPITASQKYKVVFLGNVDATLFGGEKVLSGTGESSTYEDARIHLPSIGRFNGQNLFHWFCSAPFAPSDEAQRVVPVLLQRIVSRHVLTTYGIPAEVDAGDPANDNYPKRFYSSLLQDNHPLKLQEQVFGATGSLGKQLRELLEKDIIFPIAYILRNSEDGDKLTPGLPVTVWYDEKIAEGNYWNNYVGSGRYDELTKVEAAKTVYLDKRYELYLPFRNAPEQVSRFINDLYTGKEEYMSAMVDSIKTTDIRYIDEGYQGTSGSFTLTKNEVAAALQSGQNVAGRLLYPWFNYGNEDMYITLKGPIPSAIDFDLDVKETIDSPAEAGIKLTASAEREDRHLEIMLLGDRKESNPYVFGYQNLLGTKRAPVAQPEQALTGGAISPNVSTTYRIVPENLSLGDVTQETSKEIVIRYSGIIGACMLNSTPPDGFTDRPTLETLFKIALKFSRNLPIELTNDTGWDLSSDLGRLCTDSYKTEQVHLDFKTPDFSNTNLTGNLIWQTETGK